MPLDGERPPFQVGVVLIGETGEPLLHGDAALVRRRRKTIQLRLQIREAQLQVGDARGHWGFGVA